MIRLSLLLILLTVGCDDGSEDPGRPDVAVENDGGDGATDSNVAPGDATPGDATPDGEPTQDAALEDPDEGPDPDAVPMTDAGPDAAPDGEADVDPDAEANVAVDAEADADPNPPVGADLEGTFTLTERHREGDDPLLDLLEVGGQFFEFARHPVPAEPGEMAGDCVEVVAANAGDPGEFRSVSPGDIRVAVVDEDGENEFVVAFDPVSRAFALDPIAAGLFDLWNAGDGVEVSAPGTVDFGGFQIDLPAPDDVADVAPDALVRADGAMVIWQAGNGDLVEVELRVSGAPSRVRCSSDDDGAVMVPAAAIAWLPEDADEATLRLTRVSSATALSEAPVGEVTVILERVHLRTVELD
jgi:hypothetical protein